MLLSPPPQSCAFLPEILLCQLDSSQSILDNGCVDVGPVLQIQGV